MSEPVYLTSTVIYGSVLPVTFALGYEREDIDLDRLYTLQVCVMYDGDILLTSVGPVPVLTQGHPEDTDVTVCTR